MSSTLTHAEIELDILVKSSTDPDNRPIIEPYIPELLALVEKFGNSGQSGGSAPYTAAAISQALKALCLQEPISPVTGIDDGWVNVTEYSDDAEKWFQNKRCGNLFKKGEDGEPYYLDAIIWQTPEGHAYHSKSVLMPDGSKISSVQNIKGFPFTPKTFYVQIEETEVSPDDWEFRLVDTSQLDEVFQYYSKQ